MSEYIVLTLCIALFFCSCVILFVTHKLGKEYLDSVIKDIKFSDLPERESLPYHWETIYTLPKIKFKYTYKGRPKRSFVLRVRKKHL